MKNIKQPLKTTTLLLILLITTAGCKSLPVEKSFYREYKDERWIITLFQSREQAKPVVITGPLLGKSSLTGTAYKEGDQWIIYPEKLKWFNSWTLGWTEAEWAVYGTLTLNKTEDSWSLNCDDPIKIDRVTKAQIRYKDTIIYDDKALALLTRRWLRIQTSGTYIREKFKDTDYQVLTPPTFKQKRAGLSSYHTDIRNWLFPEYYSYESPEAKERAKEHEHALAEGIWWDLDYTEKEIPEELQDIRNSGTLFRDYEESPQLFTLIWIWEDLWTETLMGEEWKVEIQEDK